MQIPIVVVDDTRSDRYIARRRLARHPDFSDIIEFATGYEFLDGFFVPPVSEQVNDRKVVILMDINMPRMSGFETVRELRSRLGIEDASMRTVIMMFTSSDNPADHQMAAEIDIVRGYIVKPLDDAGVDQILKIYNAA